jgi:hypothetical protein
MEVNPIAVSDTMKMTAIDGIMFYAFGNYRVLPRNNDDFIGINIQLDTTALPISSIGLNESDRNSKSLFSVYPNPAQNNMTLTGPKNSCYMIIDVLGRSLISGKLNNDIEEISVEYLHNGTYFLHINYESDNQIYQVIISR